eukprot:1150472-Pelagomonas_calceolata.AAC.2
MQFIGGFQVSEPEVQGLAPRGYALRAPPLYGGFAKKVGTFGQASKKEQQGARGLDCFMGGGGGNLGKQSPVAPNRVIKLATSQPNKLLIGQSRKKSSINGRAFHVAA